MSNASRPAAKMAGVLIGAAIALLGVTLLLERTGLIVHFHYNVFWGALVLAVGLVKLSAPAENGHRQGGWWVFFGAWMILNETRIWRARDSWPLLLLAAGI